MSNTVTEQNVIDGFVEHELPYVQKQYEQDGIIDKPARREAFNNYVDYLLSDGFISQRLANVISLPDELEC